MQKLTRPQLGFEEELLIMIYKLIDKKTSKIFRDPVDANQLTDYYQKIRNPIDISTIIKKLKTGQYEYVSEIKDDLQLMMANCRQYNSQLQILKTSQKFQKSIQTEWSNFQKELKRKGIDINGPLQINQEVLKRLQVIEDKNTNRKPSIMQINLIEIDKKTTNDYKFLPPLPLQLIQTDKNQNELPKQFNYNPQKYSLLKPSEKSQIWKFGLQRQQINKSFQIASIKKLAKYKKILKNKILWIQNKIIQKCLQRKRFKKMATPNYLSNYIDSGEIATNLQLRKIQMYVKMVAYWIEEYPLILSYNMKNKFIDVCRAIKKSVFRVLRYKKVPRFTKIQLDLNENDGDPMKEPDFPLLQETNQQILADQQSKRYDNQIKSFKRILSRDQGETIKKDTKIMIKNENGQFAVIDWNSQNNQKKQKGRNISINRAQDSTQQTLRLEKQKERKEERERDEIFLTQYKSRSNQSFILGFINKLEIDWDQIRLSKLPKVLQFRVQNLNIA